MSAPGLRPPLALTMGEPAGIGGEIALMAWLRRGQGVPPFVLLDDADRLAALAARTGIEAAIEIVAEPEEAAAVFAAAVPVLPVALDAAPTPGRPDPGGARAILESIDRAVALTRQGRCAAVVTNPIHKATLAQAGFAHPGHTEYLAALAGLDAPAVMMLACAALRVVPVTVHLALADAVAALDEAAIVHCGRIVADALKRDFGLARAAIAVAALNPHAGESGIMGRQEIEIVAPASERLRSEGIDAHGPLPADTLFHADARARFDAVLCMYHDQALIPLKTLDFFGGVNVTLGLPFVRTSPDHGTAFDLTGTGRANPARLIAALRMADEIAERRAAAPAAPRAVIA